MSDDPRPLFGQRGDADKILAAAKEKIEGQSMSDERLDLARAAQNAQAAKLDMEAAAAFTEEIIHYLNGVWNERNFTPEQRIFSIALATVNLREQVPEKFPNGTPGGKETFDRVCVSAREYYDAHSD